jgi:hypothetical protein
MATTPIYSWPYPALSDPPNAPTQIQSLATAVENTVNTLLNPTFSTYTPVWAGLGGGNTLTQTGRYMRLGKLCFVAATMTVTAGANLGTGAITCTLPFQAASVGNNQQWAGSGVLGGGAGYLVVATVTSGSNTAQLFANTNGAQNPGGAGDAWANGNYMTFNLWYETV